MADAPAAKPQLPVSLLKAALQESPCPSQHLPLLGSWGQPLHYPKGNGARLHHNHTRGERGGQDLHSRCLQQMTWQRKYFGCSQLHLDPNSFCFLWKYPNAYTTKCSITNALQIDKPSNTVALLAGFLLSFFFLLKFHTVMSIIYVICKNAMNQQQDRLYMNVGDEFTQHMALPVLLPCPVQFPALSWAHNNVLIFPWPQSRHLLLQPENKWIQSALKGQESVQSLPRNELRMGCGLHMWKCRD